MNPLVASEDLLSAINQGRLDGMRAALAQKADPEFTRSESTPLMMAVDRGSLEMVELLLEAGAEPGRSNRLGWTALHQAAREGHTEIAVRLAQGFLVRMARDSEGWTPVRAAIESDRVATALALLDAGCNASMSDRQGVCPLMAAADRQQKDVVAKLLALGLDPDRPDEAGRSARDRMVDWGPGMSLLKDSTCAEPNPHRSDASGAPSDAPASPILSRIRKRSPS